MQQAPVDLLNEKLASVASDIEAIEKMIASEPSQTSSWRSAPYRSYSGAWPPISESPSPSSSSIKVNFWGQTVLQ
ncbi:hypothetical protein HDF12_000188 [Edaphobacter lichenicola]|uniref:Uncharacterized protein n=1 Tax=Tunturiibacter lichenicola TaxID=2051959 RepID=A0A7Y9NJ94_9BACT|nr:hypothetical protein [Edaphobacter lichenicola]